MILLYGLNDSLVDNTISEYGTSDSNYTKSKYSKSFIGISPFGIL